MGMYLKLQSFKQSAGFSGFLILFVILVPVVCFCDPNVIINATASTVISRLCIIGTDCMRLDRAMEALLTWSVTRPFCLSKIRLIIQVMLMKGIKALKKWMCDCDFRLRHRLTNPHCCCWPYLSLSFRKKICKQTSISILLLSAHLHFTHLAVALILNLHLDSIMCFIYYLKLLTVAATLKSVCSADPFWKG